MTLELPWPPQANHLYTVARGRKILSSKGRAYRANVLASCLEQRAPRLGTARIALTVTAHPPDRRKRDLDNLTKGLLDALQYARVFNDDAQVDHLAITRGEVRKGGQLLVHIEAIT